METVTSSDGTTITHERSGSGPALVIVNGALSMRASGAPLDPLLDMPGERLSAIPCPVLGTTGSLGAPSAAPAVRAVAEAVPDGEWRVLEGQSDNVAPDVLASVLRERFL